MKIAITYDPALENFHKVELSGINSYHNLVNSSIATALEQSGHQLKIYEADLQLEHHLH